MPSGGGSGGGGRPMPEQVLVWLGPLVAGHSTTTTMEHLIKSQQQDLLVLRSGGATTSPTPPPQTRFAAQNHTHHVNYQDYATTTTRAGRLLAAPLNLINATQRHTNQLLSTAFQQQQHHQDQQPNLQVSPLLLGGRPSTFNLHNDYQLQNSTTTQAMDHNYHHHHHSDYQHLQQTMPTTRGPFTSYEWLMIVTLISIILISIVGNLLVCIAIFTDRRLRKLGNAFIVSLAIADLFVSFLVMTFALHNDLMEEWIFGPWFCDIWISFDIMCCTASILNLCAISLDRFIHIKDCLLYNQLMTRRVAISAVIMIWIISALVSFVPITLGWHKPSPGGLSSIAMGPALHAPESSLLTTSPPSQHIDELVSALETLPVISGGSKNNNSRETGGTDEEGQRVKKREAGQDIAGSESLVSSEKAWPEANKSNYSRIGASETPNGSAPAPSTSGRHLGPQKGAGGDNSSPSAKSNLSSSWSWTSSRNQEQAQVSSSSSSSLLVLAKATTSDESKQGARTRKFAEFLHGESELFAASRVAPNETRPLKVADGTTTNPKVQAQAQFQPAQVGEKFNLDGGEPQQEIKHLPSAAASTERRSRSLEGARDYEGQEQEEERDDPRGLVPTREGQMQTKLLDASGGDQLENGRLLGRVSTIGNHHKQAPTTTEQAGAAAASTPGHQDEPAQCMLTLTPTYAVISSTISFYIPCIIMLGLYSKLFACARRHVRNIKAISKAPQPIDCGTLLGSSASTNNNNNNNNNISSSTSSGASNLAAIARPAGPANRAVGRMRRLIGRAAGASGSGSNQAEPSCVTETTCGPGESQPLHGEASRGAGGSCGQRGGRLAKARTWIKFRSGGRSLPSAAANSQKSKSNEAQVNQQPETTTAAFAGNRQPRLVLKSILSTQQQREQPLAAQQQTSKCDTTTGNAAAVGGPVSQALNHQEEGDDKSMVNSNNDHTNNNNQELEPFLASGFDKSMEGSGGRKSTVSANAATIKLNMIAGGGVNRQSSAPAAASTQLATAGQLRFQQQQIAHNQQQRVQQQQQAPQCQQQTTKQQTSQLATHKAAITLGIIMGTFLLCWLPFFCLNILKAFYADLIPTWLFRASTWLGYANSALNPIIYGIHNSEFRNAFNRIFFKHLTLKNGRQYLNRRFSYDLRAHHNHSHQHNHQHHHQQQQQQVVASQQNNNRHDHQYNNLNSSTAIGAVANSKMKVNTNAKQQQQDQLVELAREQVGKLQESHQLGPTKKTMQHHQNQQQLTCESSSFLPQSSRKKQHQRQDQGQGHLPSRTIGNAGHREHQPECLNLLNCVHQPVSGATRSNTTVHRTSEGELSVEPSPIAAACLAVEEPPRQPPPATQTVVTAT